MQLWKSYVLPLHYTRKAYTQGIEPRQLVLETGSPNLGTLAYMFAAGVLPTGPMGCLADHPIRDLNPCFPLSLGDWI